MTLPPARPLVRVSVADGVSTVTLDDPDRRNALSDDLLDQLLAALDGARADDAVRVVVLASSHERVFSAGGDLTAFSSSTPPVAKYAGLDRFPRVFALIGSLGKPVICAAGGDVLAGGFGLALACDLIIAKDTARFGCPEINVGVFPFMVSALIYRNVPRMKANELMLLGDPIPASVGAELGFVNVVVPGEDFDAVVADWAGRLASKSPLLMRLGKNAIDATRDLDQRAALSALQTQLALAFTTEDIREGVQAFKEKRPPRWRLR